MLAVFQNNVYLSLIAGTIVAIFSYVDNKRLQDNKRPPNLSYLKILLVSAALTYIVLYIRTRKFDIPSIKVGGATAATSATSVQFPLQEAMDNVNIGDPNF